MKIFILLSLVLIISSVAFSQLKDYPSSYKGNYTQGQINYFIDHFSDSLATKMNSSFIGYGSDNFAANKFTDTVNISGLTSSSLVAVTLKNPSGVDTISCTISATPITNKLVVIRSDTAKTSTIGYMYFYKK